MQHPILALLEGGMLDQDTCDAQEREAWGIIATACSDALRVMDRRHPQRREFVEMWIECRTAAGLKRWPGRRRSA